MTSANEPMHHANAAVVEPTSAETHPEIAGEAGTTAPEFQPGVFRTRVVPGMALAMVLGLLGLLAWSLFAPDSQRTNGRIDELSGSRLENGRDAPNFAGETFDGTPFELDAQRGKIVIVNFWASWCGPCRDEMPLLVTAESALPDDVVLVGVNVQDDEDAARKFVADYAADFPALRTGSDAVMVDYGVTKLPETIVVDAEGKIVARLIGPVSSIEQLQAMIALARPS